MLHVLSSSLLGCTIDFNIVSAYMNVVTSARMLTSYRS